MEKITDWVKKRKAEFSLLAKYWPPIIKDSITASIYLWATALGLVFIATIIAAIVTYKRQGTINMDSFFPPNFWSGVLIGLLAIFLYHIFIETAGRLDKYRIGSDKYTWNDISIIIPQQLTSGPIAATLDIVNNKPFDIQNANVKLSSVLRNRFPEAASGKLPLNFPWISSKGEHWGGKKLGRDGTKRTAVLATWISEDTSPIFRTSPEASIQLGIAANTMYEITLEWSGEINGHPMDEFSTTYALRFDGSKFQLEEIK